MVSSHAVVLCQLLGVWYMFVFSSVKEIAVCLTVGADLQYSLWDDRYCVTQAEVGWRVSYSVSVSRTVCTVNLFQHIE